jgi:hypothetical protein
MKPKAREALVDVLEARFEKNPGRHPRVSWTDVVRRLQSVPSALDALAQMEATGGEPDIVGDKARSGEVVFFDCSAQSPAGRRSTCYDGAARTSRREHAPERSAVEMAATMGIELMSEVQYRALQEVGEFDAKTSSWVRTPADIRRLGGALFCDRRYGRVFVYHNGAQSYYAARGFRGVLRV